MKQHFSFFIAFSFLLFFAGTPNNKIIQANKVPFCGSTLSASNNLQNGTTRIYRVTYYDGFCQSVSKVLNLYPGQSVMVSDLSHSVCATNEITVRIIGAFFYVSIDGPSGEIVRQYYTSGTDNTFAFFSVDMSPCAAAYTINVW